MFQVTRNPIVDSLRNTIPQQEDIGQILRQLRSKTEYIHAGFLLEKYARKLMIKICLSLSGTNNNIAFSGWYDFGIDLGIDRAVMQCIKHSLHSQDPTYYILEAYSQKENATIAAIIEALHKLKRYDVILMIRDDLNHVINIISSKFGNTPVDKLLRPKFKYPSMGIFLNVKTAPRKERTPKKLVQNPVPVQSKYSKVVLLTFTEDGAEFADEITQSLRKQPERIGVIQLKEHMDNLQGKMENFVFECCCQVDLIIPIITEKYIRRISSFAENTDSLYDGVDDYFVTYIYKFMNIDFLRNGCCNTMVRSIIPDEILEMNRTNPVMYNPLFQIWYKLSEVQSFSENLVCRK